MSRKIYDSSKLGLFAKLNKSSLRRQQSERRKKKKTHTEPNFSKIENTCETNEMKTNV